MSWRHNSDKRGDRRQETRQAGQPSPQLQPRPFGDIIDSIDIKALFVEEKTPSIENAEYLASYNWLDGREPILLVPGMTFILSIPSTWLLSFSSSIRMQIILHY